MLPPKSRSTTPAPPSSAPPVPKNGRTSRGPTPAPGASALKDGGPPVTVPASAPPATTSFFGHERVRTLSQGTQLPPGAGEGRPGAPKPYVAQGPPPLPSPPAQGAWARRQSSAADSLVKSDGTKPDVALRYFCLVALNLNEFVFLD